MPDIVRQFFARAQALTDAEWQVLQPLLRQRRVPAGTQLLRAGDVCRDLAFVESGLLRYFLVRDGTEFTGNFFFEGSAAADYGSFVTQRPAQQWVDAITDSVVWLLGYHDVQRLYASSPAWERRGRLIAEFVLSAAQRRAAAFVLEDAETRYRALLAERPKVLERVPKFLIASYLGISPEALSRVRRRVANAERARPTGRRPEA